VCNGCVVKDCVIARWIGQASLNEDFLTHPKAELLSPWLSMVSSCIHTSLLLISTFSRLTEFIAFSKTRPRCSSGSWNLHAIPLVRQYPPIRWGAGVNSDHPFLLTADSFVDGDPPGPDVQEPQPQPQVKKLTFIEEDLADLLRPPQG
jgi:hypothetical protein